MPWDERDDRKKAARVAATDDVLEKRHTGFDKAAQDITPKYHRPHFAVVGEGTETATKAYHEGYELIDWSA